MQRLLLGCNFVSKIMFTFDMQQNFTVRLMGLIDRIMQKNSLLKAIICCQSAIIFINTNNTGGGGGLF